MKMKARADEKNCSTNKKADNLFIGSVYYPIETIALFVL